MRRAPVWTLVAGATLWLLAPSCASSGPCRYNSDCLQAYCDNGTCKVDCVDAKRDCPPGYICNENAQCAPPTDGGVPSEGGASDGASDDASGVAEGGSDAGTGPEVGSGTDASTTPDSPAGDTGTGATGREFDLCTGSSCAAPLVCAAILQGGQPRCTRNCASNADCMTDTVCVAPSGSQKICVWNDVGKACTAASSCQFGCLTSQQYCTVPCSTGSDCPNGYGCMPVGTPPTNVCVKAEAPCDSTHTSACIAPSACDMSAAMIVSGCTTACNSAADCPQRAKALTPWTCSTAGLCQRPADVVGPLPNGAAPAQYACNASSQVVNVCNDAQHMNFASFTIPSQPAVNCSAMTTTPGVAGDSCVDSCRYQGGCPFGYACTAVGSANSARIGLCLPALGGGAVGAACTSSADCFFGYCDGTSMKCTRDCTADGVCPTGSTCTAAGGSLPTVEGSPFRKCQ